MAHYGAPNPDNNAADCTLMTRRKKIIPLRLRSGQRGIGNKTSKRGNRFLKKECSVFIGKPHGLPLVVCMRGPPECLLFICCA